MGCVLYKKLVFKVEVDGDGKEEPDFIETHCHWTNCDKEYGNQDDLVKVIL